MNLNAYIKNIIEKDFADIIDSSKDSTLAKTLLYAISHYGYLGMNINDIKNFTFAPTNEIQEMLKRFEEYNIIKKISKADYANYIVTHDYLITFLEEYCNKELSPNIASNIRFYCNEKEKYAITEVRNSSNYYNSFYGIKVSKAKSNDNKKCGPSGYVIKTCTALLAIIVLSILAFGYITNPGYEWEFDLYAMAILVIGFSLFYMYHYLYYFARMFLRRPVKFESCLFAAVIIFGMIMVPAMIIYRDWWGVHIAVVYAPLGAAHFRMAVLCNNNEMKRRFNGEGVLYVVIVALFSGMMLFINFLGQIMQPWYIIYLAFIILTIRQHINEDFIIAKLSSFVVLNNKTNEMDIKIRKNKLNSERIKNIERMVSSSTK